MFDFMSKMKKLVDAVEEAGAILDPREEMKKFLALGPAVVNPREILDMGAVKPIEGASPIIIDPEDGECQLQQNGIDLRLDSVSVVKRGASSIFTRYKLHDKQCVYEEVPLQGVDMNMEPLPVMLYTLQAGRQHAMDFMEEIDVPENMSAYLFVRSSINRYSGSFLTGYWDSGFRGRLGGIYRPSVNTYIDRGCRVAQVVFFRSDSARLYDGQYQDQGKQV